MAQETRQLLSGEKRREAIKTNNSEKNIKAYVQAFANHEYSIQDKQAAFNALDTRVSLKPGVAQEAGQYKPLILESFSTGYKETKITSFGNPVANRILSKINALDGDLTAEENKQLQITLRQTIKNMENSPMTINKDISELMQQFDKHPNKPVFIINAKSTSIKFDINIEEKNIPEQHIDHILSCLIVTLDEIYQKRILSLPDQEELFKTEKAEIQSLNKDLAPASKNNPFLQSSQLHAKPTTKSMNFNTTSQDPQDTFKNQINKILEEDVDLDPPMDEDSTNYIINKYFNNTTTNHESAGEEKIQEFVNQNKTHIQNDQEALKLIQQADEAALQMKEIHNNEFHHQQQLENEKSKLEKAKEDLEENIKDAVQLRLAQLNENRSFYSKFRDYLCCTNVDITEITLNNGNYNVVASAGVIDQIAQEFDIQNPDIRQNPNIRRTLITLTPAQMCTLALNSGQLKQEFVDAHNVVVNKANKEIKELNDKIESYNVDYNIAKVNWNTKFSALNSKYPVTNKMETASNRIAQQIQKEQGEEFMLQAGVFKKTPNNEFPQLLLQSNLNPSYQRPYSSNIPQTIQEDEKSVESLKKSSSLVRNMNNSQKLNQSLGDLNPIGI